MKGINTSFSLFLVLLYWGIFSPSPLGAQATFLRFYPNDIGTEIIRECHAQADGSVIAAGYIQPGNIGGRDLVLKKIAQDGAILWARSYGGLGTDDCRAMAVTDDGEIYLHGRTNSSGAGSYDLFLVKLDEDGQLLWAKTYGNNFSQFFGKIISTQDGGTVFTGYSFLNNTVDDDVFVVRTDSMGDTLWTRNFHIQDDDHGNAICKAFGNGFLIVGDNRSAINSQDPLVIRLDNNGDTLWTRSFHQPEAEGFYDADPAADGGYWLSGATTQTDPSYSDMSVYKLDSLGNLEFAKALNYFSEQGMTQIVATADTGCIGFAYDGGSPGPGYLVKFDKMGNVEWTQSYLPTGGDFPIMGAYAMSQNYDGTLNLFGELGVNGKSVPLYFKTDEQGDPGCGLYARTLSPVPLSLTGYDNFTINSASHTVSNWSITIDTLIYRDSIICQNIVCQASFSSNVSQVCEGGTVNFTNTSSFTNIYEWAIDGIPFSTAEDTSYTFSTQGSYQIRLIAGDGGGCADTASTTLNVVAAPQVNLGPNPSACFGDSICLDAGPGFASYFWCDGGTNQINCTTIAGTCWVTVTDINTCEATDSIITSFNPLPGVGFSYSQLVDTLYFMDTTTNALSWNWDFGDNNSSTLENPSHFYSADGTYYVCLSVTDINGCVDSICDSVNVILTYNAAEIIFSNIEVYPNPVESELYIETEFEGSYFLYDLTGRILEGYFGHHFPGKSRLTLQDLPKGIYFLRIIAEDQMVWRRIVKK